MLRKFISLAVLALSTLLQTSPAPLHALSLEPAGLAPAALPAGGLPVSSPPQADFERDGLPERLALAEGRLTILSNGMSAWQSPAGWTVVQAQITDLNQDGQPEAALLVW